MRANGVADYPYPTGNSQVCRATSCSDSNPADPTVQAASTPWTKYTGFVSKFGTGACQPGSIDLEMVGGLLVVLTP